MGGGLLQLVAYGAQDVYLTGNPQITFWKVSYRRYTNFSMEAIEQEFNGQASTGGRVTCQISRNGDLIHKMYLSITTSNNGTTAAVCRGYMYALIQYVEVEIGGQRIDRQYGEWMSIWNQLSLPLGKHVGFCSMVDYVAVGISGAGTTKNIEAIIPLEFWFCRNPGLALPLIALQYHEVKINIQFNPESTLRKSPSTASNFVIGSANLWVDYIFLDTDERRRMAQNPHEYLIDQVQFTGASTLNTGSAISKSTIHLNFNHPVKELIWVAHPTYPSTGTNSETVDSFSFFSPIISANLQLNGQDRFASRNGSYFNTVQPLQCHSNIPLYPGFLPATSETALGDAGIDSVTSGIHVYSFSLRPEEHQPSGTCNFSRIDSATLNLTTKGTGGILVVGEGGAGNQPFTLPELKAAPPTSVNIYAINYNVLRIMSGMGGLAYSN